MERDLPEEVEFLRRDDEVRRMEELYRNIITDG